MFSSAIKLFIKAVAKLEVENKLILWREDILGKYLSQQKPNSGKTQNICNHSSEGAEAESSIEANVPAYNQPKYSLVHLG